MVMDLEESRAPAVVRSEPLTYNERSADSFFVDVARSQRQGDRNGNESRSRLARHRKEMDVERRTNPRSVLGQGGEFTPPLWVVSQFSTPARAGRVLADLYANFHLPPGWQQVNIPLITTGASDALQTADGAPASETDEVTGNVAGNKNVVTIAGESDASQQLFDLTPSPGYDAIVYLDLNRAYNESLENQLTRGTGTGGQLTGVTQITGRQTDVSGSGTSATQATGVATLKPLVGQAVAAIGNNRKLPADNLIMAPRRWSWIATDVSEIPQTQTWPYYEGATVGETQLKPIQAQSFAGVPTYQSAACMNATTGTQTQNQASDVIIAIRSTDAYLYESDPYFAVMENTLSGTLEVRLQLRRYVAFPIIRPAGIACVTALPAPTAFGA